MEIKKENLGKSKIKITIKIPSAMMRGFFSRIYNKLAPTVEVKGFRKGMAPRALVISAIGENRLNSEIIDLALKETYSEALKKENILPIASPKVNIKMMKELTADTAELEYEAEIDTMPEIKLGDYKKIKIETKKLPEIKVTDDEVEKVISHLRGQAATFNDIERPLKTGDRAEIDFEGFERGVKLENLSSKNYPVILGSKVLIPEFEKELIGLKKGDKKEFKIEIKNPVAKEKSAQGQSAFDKKKVDFKVEVLQTQEVILPELNDEFVKKFQKKTVKELKEAIKNDIYSQKGKQEHGKIENQILEELLKITEVEVPDSIVEQEAERQINDIRSKVAMQGLTFENYLKNIKRTQEEFKNDLRPQAEKTVKIGLALGEVVKKEGLDPKDKDAAKLALNKLKEYAIK